MIFQKITTQLSLILLLISTQCTQDETPTKIETKPPLPTFEFQTTPIPNEMLQSADSMVQAAVNLLELANSFNEFRDFYSPPEGYQDLSTTTGKPWNWICSWMVYQIEWFSGSVRVKMTVTEYEDAYYLETKVTFKHDPSWNEWVDWRYLVAEIARDRSDVFLAIYDIDTRVVKYLWIWETNIDNQTSKVLSQNLEMAFSPTIEKPERIAITYYPDGNGDMKYYKTIDYHYTLQASFEWNIDGSGIWYRYKNEEVIEQGSW